MNEDRVGYYTRKTIYSGEVASTLMKRKLMIYIWFKIYPIHSVLHFAISNISNVERIVRDREF